MCTLAWERVRGAKMLKMEQTKGCMGVKQRNSLPRDIAPPEQTGQDGMKELEGEASHASRLPERPRCKDWKPPAIPQPGIPTGRGCHRQGLCQRGTVTSLASSWPAAGRGREQIWDAEEQIKAVTDELWQEELWQLPSLLSGKRLPPQLSCSGLDPSHHQFGHRCQDQVPPGLVGQRGKAKHLQAEWAELICQNLLF